MVTIKEPEKETVTTRSEQTIFSNQVKLTRDQQLTWQQHMVARLIILLQLYSHLLHCLCTITSLYYLPYWFTKHQSQVIEIRLFLTNFLHLSTICFHLSPPLVQLNHNTGVFNTNHTVVYEDVLKLSHLSWI